MIRKTAALDHGELAFARNLRTKLSPGKQTRTSREEHCKEARLGRLGGASLVSMMKSAHLRNFHNKTVLRFVDGSRLRRIFGQGQMRARFAVVMKVASEGLPQRPLVPHNHVVQALPANGSDQSLHVRILPRRLRRRDHFIPMPFATAVTSFPKIASRSRIKYRGAWSHGNASRICCAVHSSVGCSVTLKLKCTTRRRSWERTTKTNRTRNKAVGTIKKSIDAICFM